MRLDPGRPSNVSMMQATDFGNRDDLAHRPPLDGPDVRRILLEGEVSPRADNQRCRIHHPVSERTSARPSSCLLQCSSMVTKTVTAGRDSRASQGITASHRVTGNPSILLTGPHGTARHSQLPKLDVAGLIPVGVWRGWPAAGYCGREGGLAQIETETSIRGRSRPATSSCAAGDPLSVRVNE